MAKPTRQVRQARSMRVMFGLVAALCVSVLTIGAVQFGATGLRAFITRQGGVGATPDTKDCGHLSACNNPGSAGTSGKDLVAASTRRHKSRKPKRSTSSVHRRTTLAAGAGTATPTPSGAGTSAESTSPSLTTTSTAQGTSTLAGQPVTPEIRRITTATTSVPTTTTTTTKTTTTTTTVPTLPAAITARVPLPRVPPTASERRSRPSERPSGRTAGATRSNNSSNNESGEGHHTRSH